MWEVFSILKSCVHCRCWPSTVCMSSANRLWKTARTGSRSSRLQRQNQSHLKYSWSVARYVMCVRDVEFCCFFVVRCNYLISLGFFSLRFMFYIKLVLFPLPCICLSQHCSVSISVWHVFIGFQYVWNKLLKRHYIVTRILHKKNKLQTLIMQFSTLFLCPVISLRNIRITNDRQLCKNKEDTTSEVEDKDKEEGSEKGINIADYVCCKNWCKNAENMLKYVCLSLLMNVHNQSFL